MNDNDNEKEIIEMKIDKEELNVILNVFQEKFDNSLSYSKKEELSIKFQKIYDKIMILLFVWLIKILFVWLIS
jgi:hypothetical protein